MTVDVSLIAILVIKKNAKSSATKANRAVTRATEAADHQKTNHQKTPRRSRLKRSRAHASPNSQRTMDNNAITRSRKPGSRTIAVKVVPSEAGAAMNAINASGRKILRAGRTTTATATGINHESIGAVAIEIEATATRTTANRAVTRATALAAKVTRAVNPPALTAAIPVVAEVQVAITVKRDERQMTNGATQSRRETCNLTERSAQRNAPPC